MNIQTKIIFITILFISVFSASYYFFEKNTPVADSSAYTLTVNNIKVDLMVANDEISKEKGLGDRDSIPENASMLFIFDKPEKYGIWMKDMKFNIDIVWLNSEKKIVHIEKNVSPDTYPDVFFPPEDSLYIMEFNGGFSDKNMLSVGNVLDIIKK